MKKGFIGGAIGFLLVAGLVIGFFVKKDIPTNWAAKVFEDVSNRAVLNDKDDIESIADVKIETKRNIRKPAADGQLDFDELSYTTFEKVTTESGWRIDLDMHYDVGGEGDVAGSIYRIGNKYYQQERGKSEKEEMTEIGAKLVLAFLAITVLPVDPKTGDFHGHEYLKNLTSVSHSGFTMVGVHDEANMHVEATIGTFRHNLKTYTVEADDVDAEGKLTAKYNIVYNFK